MATLSEVRLEVRDAIDEVEPGQFWTDAQLNVWINEGCRDIARRSESIQSFITSITVNVGQATYPLPSNVIRLHRVQFRPTGSQQTYKMMLTTYEEMDQVWGIQQDIQSSYPTFAMMWGTSGNTSADAQLLLRVYPVPANPGTLEVFYYRLPTPLVNDTDVVEVPAGWHDLISAYCIYKALRKDRDPTWQDAKAEYEEKMQYLIDVTRELHDAGRYISTESGIPQPQWLYGGGLF